MVIDDSSKDGTIARVRNFQKKYSNIRLICLESNKGLALARNGGLELDQCKYISFLDADDLNNYDR